MKLMKNIILTFLCLIILFSVKVTSSFTDDDNDMIKGKCYTTNIKAYVNGKYIESYNINGNTYVDIDQLSNYGYDVVKNDETSVTSILTNYYPDKESVVNESISYPVYENHKEDDYKDFIDYVEPSYDTVSTIHGTTKLMGTVKDTVTVHFSKNFKKEYINPKYVPIYYRDKNVSNYFLYTYDEDSKQLTIKMKPESFSNYKFDDENFTRKDYHNNREIFTVYFLNGIKDQSGATTKKVFKYCVEFDLDASARAEIPNKLIGEYTSTKDEVYVVDESGSVEHNIYSLNGKRLICIEALGDFYWDGTRKNIYAYSITYRNNLDREYISKLKEASKALTTDTYNNLIKSTNPIMELEKTVHSEAVEKISGSMNEIVISFNKAIKEEYINEKYIPIYMKDEYVGYWFERNYDRETNTLKLTLRKINDKINLGNDFSRVLYDQDDNIIDNYIGSRFDVYLMEGIASEDGDMLKDTLRLTCDVSWRLDEDENALIKTVSSDLKQKVKEVTTWNINGTEMISFREYDADSLKEEYENTSSLIKPLEEMEWSYYRRIAKPLYKGFVDDWIADVTPTTELIKRENDSVVQKVGNTNSEVTIVFKKDIDESYINSEYIKIFEDSNKISYRYEKNHSDFIFVYDKDNKKLVIKTKDSDKVSGTYDIYLMKGIASDTGEKLTEIIRLTVGIAGKEK
ncbi:hypothetical protein R9X47_28395 [Wukongibacter baidiensis]|uniref:hypothetical protein n=1 Tax=Wukongibacter baidiensis TaxID=1723361 RepID=UPI003D7FFC29